MFFTELETKRMQLKNISRDDREFMFRQFSDSDVSRYLYDEEPFTDISEADGLIDFYLEEEPRNQHRWILVSKEDGTKMGTCGFHCWDRSTGYCEIGYDLYPDFWHHGYATEALDAILAFAQKEMQVKEIAAHVAKENIASAKLLQKHVFVDSGETVIYVFRGKEYPHNVFKKTLFYDKN